MNVTTHGAMLDNSTLDATLAASTITEARKKSYNFSRPYYTDRISVLVKKSSGIVDLADLDGKIVGAALSATTRGKLTALGSEIGVHMSFAEHSTHPAIKIALVTGHVGALSADRSILNGGGSICGKIEFLAIRKRVFREGGQAIWHFRDSLAIKCLLTAFET